MDSEDLVSETARCTKAFTRMIKSMAMESLSGRFLLKQDGSRVGGRKGSKMASEL